MTTIVDARYHEMHWSGALRDAPVTTKHYGSAQIRPFKINVRYRVSAGTWEAITAEIMGPSVKKDDTNGKTWVTFEYWLDLSEYTPQWIIDIAATYLPKVKP
jgi:hypothetical protein